MGHVPELYEASRTVRTYDEILEFYRARSGHGAGVAGRGRGDVSVAQKGNSQPELQHVPVLLKALIETHKNKSGIQTSRLPHVSKNTQF